MLIQRSMGEGPIRSSLFHTSPPPLPFHPIRRPAVILIHAFKWFHHEDVGNYCSSSESQSHDFATYHGLPELSVKAAAWNLMNAGE